MNLLSIEKSGEKWYKNSLFPLLPLLRLYKRDSRHSSGFCFQWLFVKVWTLDHIEIELSFVCSTHWGIGITGIIPYLRFVFCLPCPERLEVWFSDKTNRAPTLEKDEQF